MNTKSSGASHIIELNKKAEIFFKEKVPQLGVVNVPKFLTDQSKKLPLGKAANEVKEIILPAINGKIPASHAAKILLANEMRVGKTVFPHESARATQEKNYQNFFDNVATAVEKHGEKILLIKNEELTEA